ncbi:MAG TPA: TAXI family TRAP transporter solute-binding subunit [Steroidobacteraceae bacterium]|jgi:TRAP-type uncharacterized transport system substrate-binding protein
MATGPPGGAYARTAARYREILARDGVNLRLVPTNGAVENVRLLLDRRSTVSVGLVQAGSVSEKEGRGLASLGTVFYEAVWVFCRCSSGHAFADLSDGRLSIGPEGSAGRPLALKLLALNGVDTQRLELFGYPPQEAGRALLEGKIGGAVILTGWDSSVAQELARAPNITLQGFPRADAYVALDRTFSKVRLPRGVADLAHDRPPEDMTLIALKASLVVRKDLHPALQYLLVRAAMEVHGRAEMFQHANEFPAPEEIDLPLSDEARHVYTAGPSFLQRTLPFWLAELVQRLLILIVPVVGFIYPLWSLVPRLYRWRVQQRIYRLYGELKSLERDLRLAPLRESIVRRLDDMDRRVLELHIPAAYGPMAYDLKLHIHALREQASTLAKQEDVP